MAETRVAIFSLLKYVYKRYTGYYLGGTTYLKMRTKLLLILFIISGPALTQQESHITIDSAHHTEVTVTQQEQQSLSQKSGIDIKRSDSNKVHVTQGQQQDAPVKPAKPTGFMRFVSNTKAIIALCISLATLIGLAWKGIPYLKRNKHKK